MRRFDCALYKKLNIWKSYLCKLCVASKCKDRAYDYDLAGSRWSLKVRKEKDG